MSWLRTNAVGLLALALAVVALALGFDAHRTAVRRDEQARAVERRLERGEADLAEQHRRGADVLRDLADVLRTLTYYAAGAAIVVGAWDVWRRWPNLWLTGATALLAVGAIALAVGSRA
jgi:hypothetical protein